MLWPGMDAAAFYSGQVTLTPPRREWVTALVKMSLGLVLLTAVAPRISSPIVRGWLGMIGTVFLLHFGAFHVLSCFWRAQGVAAVPLMDEPIKSQSLAEFWGRRWNRAFRDLTHRFLFLPLAPRIGAASALMAGFIVSGLIHDAVISWPADSGWGWPTAYFLLQGIALLLERSRIGRAAGLGGGLRGRLYTAAVLLLPVSWLFPAAFVTGVYAPFVDDTGFPSWHWN